MKRGDRREGYLLVNSSLVSIEETILRVGDLQVRSGVEPFVFGIEWLLSKLVRDQGGQVSGRI